MTTKKKKFATTLLTTALFTYGFSLEADAVPHTEEQPPTEVCVRTTETEPQHLVENEPTKRKTGQPSPRKATVSPFEPTEEQPPLEKSEEQTQGEQALFEDSVEQLPDSETQDPAPSDSRKHHSKTGQPSPENAPTSHGKPPREQPPHSKKNPAQPNNSPNHPRISYRKFSTTPTNLMVTR